MSESIAKYVKWPTPYFLPDDSYEVIICGVHFLGVSFPDYEMALADIEEKLSLNGKSSFWVNMDGCTFIEVVARVKKVLNGNIQKDV